MALLTQRSLTGGPYGDGWEDFVQVGTTPNEIRHILGINNASALGTNSWTIDQLRAHPFVTGRGGVIDRLTFEVTTGGGAGCKGRVGIYKSIDDNTLYPGALLVDGGEWDCTSIAVKDSVVLATLQPNKLYWYVVHTGGGTACTIRVGSLNNYPPILGVPATIGANPNVILNGAQAYAALPAAYPAGATATTLTVPAAVTVRFIA